ncbi:MAG TPA: acyl carrier protein [Candidatus Aminicenantes bacterium]|nr:acyl carrier protein [Candidatus Aminicenantes bacterium]
MDKILRALREIHPEHDYLNSEDFIEDSLLDSFDVVILVKKLEEGYGINIDGADVIPENFRNVKTIHSLIERSADGQL